MAYVERRGGVIVGVYASPQPGIAEEVVADDAPEVVAFRNAPTIAANAERDKHAALVAQVTGIVADLATYKAIANPTANQRLQFERRVCDVLTALLKRITQRD